MAEHETIADVIAEMHRFAKQHEYDHPDMNTNAQGIEDYADRLEAAHKREHAKIEADALAVGGIVEAAHRREMSKNASKNRANFGQLGDAAKLREALENLYDQICHGETEQHVAANRQMIRAALAAPPRNCDIGTLEDRREQFKQFCKSHSDGVACNRDCPLFKLHINGYSCHFEWGELPFESEV